MQISAEDFENNVKFEKLFKDAVRFQWKVDKEYPLFLNIREEDIESYIAYEQTPRTEQLKTPLAFRSESIYFQTAQEIFQYLFPKGNAFKFISLCLLFPEYGEFLTHLRGATAESTPKPKNTYLLLTLAFFLVKRIQKLTL